MNLLNARAGCPCRRPAHQLHVSWTAGEEVSVRTTKIHNRHTKNGPRPMAPVRGVRQAAKVRILGRLRPEKPEHTGAAPRVWTVRTLKRPKAPADRKHRPG